MVVTQVTNIFPFAEPAHVAWGRDLSRWSRRALGLHSSRTVQYVLSRTTTCQRLICFPCRGEKKECGALMGKIPIQMHFYRDNMLSSRLGLLGFSEHAHVALHRPSCSSVESEMIHFVTYLRYFLCKSVLVKYICSTVQLSTALTRLVCPPQGVWGHRAVAVSPLTQ